MAILSTNNKLSLILLLDNVCFSTFIVMFFGYVDSLGASQKYLGSILSIISLIGLVWNPIIGSLGDTYGRKIILIQMTSLSIAVNFLLVLSSSLVIIFIARILSAFSGPLIPILNAAASELKNEEKSSYFGKIPAVMSIGFMLGSLSGGFMSEFNNGYTMCFICMMMLNFINLGFVLTLPENEERKKKDGETLSISKMVQKEMRTIWQKLSNVNWKEYADIFSVKMLFEFGCGLLFRTFGPQLTSLGVRGRTIGYMFTFMSICTIIDNIILIKLKSTMYAGDKLGKKRLFHSSILFIATAVSFILGNDVYMFLIGLVFMGAARTIADSTFTEALMAKATEKDKGGVSGAFESINSLVGLTTPLAAGVLSDLYGMQFTTQLSLVPLVFGSFVTFRRT